MDARAVYCGDARERERESDLPAPDVSVAALEHRETLAPRTDSGAPDSRDVPFRFGFVGYGMRAIPYPRFPESSAEASLDQHPGSRITTAAAP